MGRRRRCEGKNPGPLWCGCGEARAPGFYDIPRPPLGVSAGARSANEGAPSCRVFVFSLLLRAGMHRQKTVLSTATTSMQDMRTAAWNGLIVEGVAIATFRQATYLLRDARNKGTIGCDLVDSTVPSPPLRHRGFLSVYLRRSDAAPPCWAPA